MKAVKHNVRLVLQRAVRVVLKSKAELILLCVSLAYNMPTTFIQNLIIQKLCLRRNYPRDYCLSNAINKTLEETMQGEASQLLLYFYLLRQLPAIILALFMGQWCDKYGRKYVIIIASTGCATSAVLYSVNAWFIEWPPIFVVLSVLPAGLSGDLAGFTLGLYGFIRDIHPMKSLSVRLGVADGALSLGAQMGPLIGAQLYNHFGSVAVFLVCTVVYIIAIIFTAILVKDEKFIKGADWRVVCRDFFDCRGFLSCAVAVFQKRKGHFRAYLLCIMCSGLITTLASSGWNETVFLYTRLTVGWDVTKLSYYASFVGGASIIGSVIFFPLLAKAFHWSDFALGLMGHSANISFYLILAFTRKSDIYYGAISLLIFGTFSGITFFSIISKCISVTEIGKVIGLYAVLSAGATNLGQVVATQIYSHTYRFFPGTYLTFAGSLGFICISLYIWIFTDLRKNDMVLEEVYKENEESEYNTKL